MKRINYLNIIKWFVNVLNQTTKCGHYHLFEAPYICILQEERGECCLYSAFADASANGLGSIIAGKTPRKFFTYLADCAKAGNLEMEDDEEVKRKAIEMLNLPIEQLQVKADIGNFDIVKKTSRRKDKEYFA